MTHVPTETEFEVFWKDELQAKVHVNFPKQEVTVDSFSDNPLRNPFNQYQPKWTISRLLVFLESRCFPRTRGNVDELLDSLDLEYYTVWGIVKKTHGVDYDDFIWLRFKGEDITYADVKVRD